MITPQVLIFHLKNVKIPDTGKKSSVYVIQQHSKTVIIIT